MTRQSIPLQKTSCEEGWTTGTRVYPSWGILSAQVGFIRLARVSPRVTPRRRGKDDCGWRALVALAAAVGGFLMACLTASRGRGLAMSRSILAPAPGVHNPRRPSVLGSNGRKPVAQSRALRGVASEVAVYESPERQSCRSAGLKARIFLVAPIHART